MTIPDHDLDPPTEQGAPPRALLLLLCGIAFLIVLDTATSISALPSIQGDLGMALSDVQWVVSIYAVTFGSLMLLGGRLADLLGRRRILMAGVAVFAGASVACGTVGSPGALIVARAVQGAGAALALPASLAILVAAFPDGPARNRAIAVWNAVAGVGGIFGFLLGGPLIDGPGWRWIYLLNVPFAALVLIVAPRVADESRDRRSARRLDWAGALLATAAMIALIDGLSGVPEQGWTDPRTLASLSASTGLAAGFVAVERRAASPLVPLRLFRSPTVAGGNAILVVAGMVSGVFVTLSSFAQGVLGWSAWSFGLATLVIAIPSIVAAMLASYAIDRFGARATVAGSAVLTAGGLLGLAHAPTDAAFLADLAVPFSLIGVGLGPLGVAASVAALTGIDPDDHGVAAGVEESTYQVGTPLGVAVLTTVTATITAQALARGESATAASAAGARASFLVAAILAGVIAAGALAVLPRPGRATAAAPEPSCGGIEARHPALGCD